MERAMTKSRNKFDAAFKAKIALAARSRGYPQQKQKQQEAA